MIIHLNPIIDDTFRGEEILALDDKRMITTNRSFKNLTVFHVYYRDNLDLESIRDFSIKNNHG